MKVALVTDSSSELSQEDAERLGLTVIPNNILLNGTPYKDGIDLNTETAEFYMEQGGEMQTFPITVDEFAEVFRNLLSKHDMILCILVGERLSKNLAHAEQAVTRLGIADRVVFYDSRITTIALGRIVLRAKKLLNEGQTIEQIVPQLEDLRNMIIADSVVPSLKYFRKGKRVSAGRAIFASLFKLCPVMSYTSDGELKSAQVVKGKEGVQTLLQRIQNRYGTQPIAVTVGMTGHDEEQIDRLKHALTLSPLNVVYVTTGRIGASISAHAGPGLYGYVVEPYDDGLLF